MNRPLLTLLLCLAVLPARSQGYASLFEGETAAAMRASVGALSGVDEATAADFVREGFRTRGLDVLDSPDDSSFGIVSESGDTLVCHNAVAWIQGYDRSLRDKFIVISAPIADNASGMALLLELAGRLSTHSVLLRKSVILVAFGASNRLNAGSWYFLNRAFGKEIPDIESAVDLYQLGDGAQGFWAYTASNADLNSLLERVSGTLQPVKPNIVPAEPAVSDHRSFYAKEIPSVMFTSGKIPKILPRPEDCAFDWMERELEYIYNYTMLLQEAPAPEFIPSELRMHSGSSEAVPWNDCDVKPAFMNNYDPNVFLNKWVYVYLKYPKAAVDNGIQGKVLVDFIIDEKGKVRDVKVLRGVNPLLDEEAVKVVAASPDWKPGRVRGKRVACEMSLYVEFRLKKR
ncbi:MAG: TonB family protein [Bacteroidales bacterium]|nr:TonB family protein [Bacteroidales bacterium]